MHIKVVDTDESDSSSDSSDSETHSESEEMHKKIELIQSYLRLYTEEKRLERENAILARQYDKCLDFIDTASETGVLDFKSLEEFCITNQNPDERRELDGPNSDNDTENNSIILGSERAVRLYVSLTLYLQPLLPNGASLGAIHAHLTEKGATVSEEDLETVLRHYPAVFKEETVNENGTLNKKWYFALEIPPVPELM